MDTPQLQYLQRKRDAGDADVAVMTYDAMEPKTEMKLNELEYFWTLSPTTHAVVLGAQKMRRILSENNFARGLYAEAVREVSVSINDRLPYDHSIPDIQDGLGALNALMPLDDRFVETRLSLHAQSCIDGIIRPDSTQIGCDPRRTVSSGVIEYLALAQDYARRLERQN